MSETYAMAEYGSSLEKEKIEKLHKQLKEVPEFWNVRLIEYNMKISLRKKCLKKINI